MKFDWDYEYPYITISPSGRIKDNADSEIAYSDYVSGRFTTMAGFIRYSVEDDYIEMVQLFIGTEWRLKGYGRKLMKYLERKGKTIRIHTGSVREDPFGKFLLKMGYEYVGGQLNWEKKI